MQALVIDDSRTMRCILGRVLQQLGFEVAEADNGRAALERLAQLGRTVLALVDWNMPEMDGLEFVRAVRAERRYDGLRLMMVTTENDATRLQTALAAGADEYVMKPFTPDIIRDKLQLLGFTGAEPGAAEPTANRRALVIDDSRTTRLILRQILHQAGFEVSEAGDGRAALTLLAREGPAALALVDRHMPDMDGLEFICAVRAHARYGGLRLLLVTGEEDAAETTRVLEAGADAFVRKPFSRESILEQLHHLGLLPR